MRVWVFLLIILSVENSWSMSCNDLYSLQKENKYFVSYKQNGFTVGKITHFVPLNSNIKLLKNPTIILDIHGQLLSNRDDLLVESVNDPIKNGLVLNTIQGYFWKSTVMSDSIWRYRLIKKETVNPTLSDITIGSRSGVVVTYVKKQSVTQPKIYDEIVSPAPVLYDHGRPLRIEDVINHNSQSAESNFSLNALYNEYDLENYRLAMSSRFYEGEVKDFLDSLGVVVRNKKNKYVLFLVPGEQNYLNTQFKVIEVILGRFTDDENDRAHLENFHRPESLTTENEFIKNTLAQSFVFFTSIGSDETVIDGYPSKPEGAFALPDSRGGQFNSLFITRKFALMGNNHLIKILENFSKLQ